MPRPTFATRIEPQPTADLLDPPANDVRRDESPAYTLTDADRQRLTALALGLTHVASKTPDRWSQRVSWVSAIHARAWRDRDAITAVSFGQDPVTVEDIHDLGLRIEFVREVFAARGLTHEVALAPEGAAPASMTDAQIAAEMRRHQLTLCDPLTRRLRRSKEPAATLRPKRGALRDVKRTPAMRALTDNTVKLFALCDDPAVARWIVTLPKGEAHALARLRELHPEWTRRTRAVASRVNEPQVPDLPQRAWALVTEALPDILEAGRYLVKGDVRRAKDYRGMPTRKVAKKPEADPPKDA